MLTIQMETEIYNKLESIFAKSNLTVEEAILLFITETVKQGRIPFDYTEADIEEAVKNPLILVGISD